LVPIEKKSASCANSRAMITVDGTFTIIPLANSDSGDRHSTNQFVQRAESLYSPTLACPIAM